MEQESFHRSAKFRMHLSDKVDVREFNPDKIVLQDYDVWHLQPILVCY